MELLRSTFADLSCAVSMMPRVVRDRKEAELIMHVQQGIQTLAMIEEKLEAIFAQRNVMSRTLEVVEAYDKDQALTSVSPLLNKTILVLERQCLLLLEKHSAVRKGIKLSSQEMEKYAFLNERLALELNFFVRSAAEDKMCMSIIEKRISQTVQQFVQSVDNSYESEEATGGSKRKECGRQEDVSLLDVSSAGMAGSQKIAQATSVTADEDGRAGGEKDAAAEEEGNFQEASKRTHQHRGASTVQQDAVRSVATEEHADAPAKRPVDEELDFSSPSPQKKTRSSYDLRTPSHALLPFATPQSNVGSSDCSSAKSSSIHCAQKSTSTPMNFEASSGEHDVSGSASSSFPSQEMSCPQPSFSPCAEEKVEENCKGEEAMEQSLARETSEQADHVLQEEQGREGKEEEQEQEEEEGSSPKPFSQL